MSFEKGNRKDKNQNIQVFVRLRPLNQRERDIKSLGVVDVANHREVIVRQSQNSSHTKKFTFDRAFGPHAKQVEVYQEVVSPLIEEVLAGYNCTVFAYGQTGTGKTHTMVGESTGDEISWQHDPLAGIVPRALSQLFDELRLSNTEYTVRVSYLELYNEELFDLLASSEDNSKLRIYEDVTRKGSNIVNGLEEITVSNKNEVYKIMAQGQERKRVASTLMNAQSSRSHTVFTIVVHMRENSPEGEELVKIGKLNLVDLAGSENISKAGSDNPAKRERARECVNINQSLLTLGRVITALVERHPHIPYRESKLTRILQESLGGRTKTSIIATVSPGHKDLEETMSTLEYAHRAKNIQNKPEVNQKMTKKAILKEYAEEIDRLKRDLQASRDKNGVYLATDTYTEMTLKQEEQRKEIQDLLLQKRSVEEQRDKVENLFTELNTALEKRVTELSHTREKLDCAQTKLTTTAQRLEATKAQFEEQKHLVERVAQTEEQLRAQAQDLLTVADTATGHVRCLHDTVDKRRSVESRNLQVTAAYRSQASQHRANIAHTTKHYTLALAEGLATLHAALDEFASNNATTLHGDQFKLQNILQQIQDTMNEIKILTDESQSKLASAADSQRGQIRACVAANNAAVQSCVQALLRSAAQALQAARGQDVAGSVAAFVQQWYAGAAARMSSLCETQRSFLSRAEQHSNDKLEAATAQMNNIVARKEQTDALVQALTEEVERDSVKYEKQLSDELAEVEVERSSSRHRLEQFKQEQLRIFREQLVQYVATETAALDERLSMRIQSIERERERFQRRQAEQLQMHHTMLAASARELELMTQEWRRGQEAHQRDAACLQAYHQDFHEGTNAVSTDLEVFSSNVVEVVDQIYQQLLQAVELANKQTQEESQAVVSQVVSTGTQFIAQTDAALSDVVSTNKRIVDDMLLNMQAKNSTSMETITEVSASLSTLISASASHSGAHRDHVQEMTSQLSLLEDSVTNVVGSLEQAEGRCLAEEYKVYSPTGKTPSRVEYRYPRALAAASPHERILARFRAMRDNAHDDDCVVIESDVESRASDCESSASEDALFAAPSPPAPPATLAPPAPRHRNTIVKCTSETDIYDMKREQGKENANRSVTYRKPSKLPAPSSLKKPFVERNGLDN